VQTQIRDPQMGRLDNKEHNKLKGVGVCTWALGNMSICLFQFECKLKCFGKDWGIGCP